MLTVIIATFNGANTIGRTLQKMTSLHRPEGGWKLIVVDNGSTDDTDDIIEPFKNRLPLTTYQHLARGKNNALNSVLEYREGDLVVFTDDDVLPDENWLCELRRAADNNAQADLFGGLIEPVWPDHAKMDLANAVPVGPAFALSTPGHASGPVTATRIWGPNMAVRSQVFDTGLTFNGSVGPGEGEYQMGSETELIRRLVAQGCKAIWIEEARVGHIIRDHQITRTWLKARAFRFGRALYSGRDDGQPFKDTTVKLGGIPRWLIRRYLTNLMQQYAAQLRGQPNLAIGLCWKAQECRGMIYQAQLENRADQ